jgi:ornithine--oxo-acid transaminase
MTADPALSSRLIDQENRYGPGGQPSCEVVLTRADGGYVWDVQGNRYLDFMAGRDGLAQGHSHTRIAAAMVEQCLRLGLAGRPYRNDRLPPLLEKLCTLTGFEQAVCLEAGDTAAAALRALGAWGRRRGVAPGRAECLVFAAAPREIPEAGPGLRVVPYGDLGAAAAAVNAGTVGILVEPVQGGCGVRLPPPGFLAGLRDLGRAHRLMLIADERQCGLGRTGRWFAFEHEGVRPDGVILEHGLSGGFYPVGALLGSRQLLAGLAPASVRAGNPLACAVASAALDVLVDEKLVERAAELGAYLLERLRGLVGPPAWAHDGGPGRSMVQAVHGRGLWAELELRPEAGPARAAAEALRQEGLLCAACGASLLLCPPLTTTREQLDWALARLSRVLAD